MSGGAKTRAPAVWENPPVDGVGEKEGEKGKEGRSIVSVRPGPGLYISNEREGQHCRLKSATVTFGVR